MENMFIKFKECQYLLPILIENKEKYYDALSNIEDSWTGRIDAQIINTFIQESAQLIINAIVLFEKGYFDCAYYSLRQSLEVSTTMVYFTELSLSERTKKINAWKQQDDFPMYSKMIKYISENEFVYNDIKENLSEFFTNIKSTNKKINKIIHKQGFKFFYISRRNNGIDTKKEIMEFENYIKICIGAVAMMRLAIDPMPILLNDEEMYFRTNDEMTIPFTKEFIEEFIGTENAEKYKNTQMYIGHYYSIINNEKKLPSVADVVKHQYIDNSMIDVILNQKRILRDIDIVAISLVKISNKIAKIYIYNGLYYYFTNIISKRKKNSWKKEDFESFKKNKPPINIPYDEAYITVAKKDEVAFYIEHNELFSNSEISNIRKIENNK